MSIKVERKYITIRKELSYRLALPGVECCTSLSVDSSFSEESMVRISPGDSTPGVVGWADGSESEISIKASAVHHTIATVNVTWRLL